MFIPIQFILVYLLIFVSIFIRPFTHPSMYPSIASWQNVLVVLSVLACIIPGALLVIWINKFVALSACLPPVPTLTLTLTLCLLHWLDLFGGKCVCYNRAQRNNGVMNT